jgi:hypothetical protein
MVRRIHDFHHPLPPDAAASPTAGPTYTLTLAPLAPVTASPHSTPNADHTRTAPPKSLATMPGQGYERVRRSSSSGASCAHGL